MLSPENYGVSPLATPIGLTHGVGSLTQPPLQAIAERRSGSGGEESEEDEEDEEGGWKSETAGKPRGSHEETVLKTGYLWKKGERRKVSLALWSSPTRFSRMTISMRYAMLDVEETVVCIAPSSSSLLQNLGRVQAPPSPRTERHSFLHSRAIEEASEHVCFGLTYADILPPSRIGARGVGVGQRYHRGSDELTGNLYTKLGHRADTHT